MQKVNYHFGSHEGFVMVDVDPDDNKLSLLRKAERKVKQLHPELIGGLKLTLVPSN